MSGTLSSQGRSELVASLLSTGPRYLGFGVGSGVASATDVGLFTEVQTRVSGTISQVTTVTSGDTYQYVGTFNSTSSQFLSNLGLFSSSGSPIQGQLTSQVLSNSQSFINVSNYSNFSVSYPFQIQVSTEVMSVVSGNGTQTLYVLRGQNNSTALSSIPATTTVTQASGVLFAKTNTSLALNNGDVVQFTIGLQFQ